MTLNISQKGLILIALPLLFQLAFVLLVIRFQSENADAERLASHTKEVIAQGYEVHALVADAQASVRGYVLTGEPSFAAPFVRADDALAGRLPELERLVVDNPGQSAKVKQVQVAGETILDWLRQTTRLVGNGERDGAVNRIVSGEGEMLGEAFRRQMSEFLVEEERLDRARVAALEQSRARTSILLVAGGVAAVLTTLAVGYAFRQGVVRRFAAVHETARRLTSGLPTPPALGGKDETARLDGAFRELAAALTATSARVRDLYDHAPCGYHSVDPDGIVVEVNQTELRWLGYSAEEVVGKMRFADLVESSSRDAYRAAFELVKREGEVSDVELRLTRKGGTTFSVLVNSSAVRDADGRYVRSRTSMTDITERKRAEDEVRRLNAELEGRVQHRTEELTATNIRLEREAGERVKAEAIGRAWAARLKAIVDTAVDGIITIDERGTIETVNPAAERMFGYPAVEMVGRNVNSFMPAPYDREHDGYLERYRDTGERKIIGIGREVWGRRRDGSEFPIDLAVSETWLGEHRLFTGLVRDITDRKRAEDQLRTAVADLATSNRDLAQRNAENEMFVYSVSHDLRSPLVNLQGFSKELEKACRGLGELLATDGVHAEVRSRGEALLGGKVAKSVGFIQSAVLRLSSIIDALLRLSRAGRVEYRWEAVDVRGVVAQVVAAAQGTITDRGAAVQVGELPPTWGDRTAVEQLFANLVGNALTYLDPTRPGLIEVGTADAPVGSRTFFVRDNGLGISEAHRGKIFQPFQRAHPGVGNGEGLGLAIVARVVERHHGRVWVESTPGVGSTFFVTLPAPSNGGDRHG